MAPELWACLVQSPEPVTNSWPVPSGAPAHPGLQEPASSTHDLTYSSLDGGLLLAHFSDELPEAGRGESLLNGRRGARV